MATGEVVINGKSREQPWIMGTSFIVLHINLSNFARSTGKIILFINTAFMCTFSTVGTKCVDVLEEKFQCNMGLIRDLIAIWTKLAFFLDRRGRECTKWKASFPFCRFCCLSVPLPKIS